MERGTGLAQELLKKAIVVTEREWSEYDCSYEHKRIFKIFKFGFKAISEPYEFKCLPHIDMVCKRDKLL